MSKTITPSGPPLGGQSLASAHSLWGPESSTQSRCPGPGGTDTPRASRINMGIAMTTSCCQGAAN